MHNWEYKLSEAKEWHQLEILLKTAGDEGWELVSTAYTNEDYPWRLIYKRPKN